ncbi:hypothetical protein Trydic_g8887 [Trypoxylus dichotomus]
MDRIHFYAFGAAFGGMLVLAICLIYDRQQKRDPNYKRRLKLKREYERKLSELDRSAVLPLDIVETRKEEDVIILHELQIGEALMLRGNLEEATQHFANAIARKFSVLLLRKYDMPFERHCMKRKEGKLSNSEPDIATKKAWDCGFPPSITVDELHRYRKKGSQGFGEQGDHLYITEGSFKSIKSEYKKKYRNYFLEDLYYLRGVSNIVDLSPMRVRKPEDSLRIEGEHDLRSLYPDSYRQHPLHKLSRPKPRNTLQEAMERVNGIDDRRAGERQHSRFSTEIKSKYVTHSDAIRSEIIRQPCHLKQEGDLLTTTEKAEKFIEYLLIKREHMIRNPTTLKLEGDMERKTENMEKFIPYEYQERPPLCKKSTNLHLEGNLTGTTENHEKFIPFNLEKRQPLTKMSTNLHMEGDLEMKPEYRDAYVEFKVEKQNPTLPSHNIKLDGTYNIEAETKVKVDSYNAHPPIPFLRGNNYQKKIVLGDDKGVKYPEYREKFVEHLKTERALMRRPETHLQQRGDMQTVTENKLQYVEKHSPRAERRRMQNNLKLEGKIDMTPEYKNAYVNFYQDDRRSPVKRRGANVYKGAHLRNEGDMEINPEYKSSFINFPRERPNLKRPEGQLINEGEMHHMTEKNAMYVQHQGYAKPESIRREPELKLEGQLECQPEYRKAYIDYLIRERVERKPRPLDNLVTQHRRIFDKDDEKPQSNGVKHENVSSPKQPSKPETKPPPQQSTHVSQIPVATKRPPTSQKQQAVATHKEEPKNVPSSATSNVSKPSSTSAKPGTAKSSKVKPQPHRLKVSGTSSTQSSRSPSRAAFSSRSRSKSTSFKKSRTGRYGIVEDEPVVHRSRVGSRFCSPVKVEDLAYRPCISPVPLLLQNIEPPRRKQRSEAKGSYHDDKAFVILDKEANNNFYDKENNLYKEQRWMSPWYSPPF